MRGKENYAVKVVTSRLVEIERRYFFCENGQILGNAFLPAPCYMKTDYLETKIAQSGLVMGEPGSGFDLPCLDTARIICFANALCEAARLSTPPANPGQIKFVLTFHRFGEQLLMKGYEKYLEVIEGSRHHWYRHDEAGLLYTILTAG